MRDDSCPHRQVRCINEFELVRKYRCRDCGGVVMCSCNEAIGRQFLPHQLKRGIDLETQQQVQVTGGFRPGICPECRGLPLIPHPKNPIHGRTSKIKRFYWREIIFRTYELFAEWAEHNGAQVSDRNTPAAKEAYAQAAQQALIDVKRQHEAAPKYAFDEESQQETIEKYGVEVLALRAIYTENHPNARARVVDTGEVLSVIDFVAEHYRRLGFSVLFLESRPFHVLFAVFMWLLIQDNRDPRVRIVGFGDRVEYENERLGRVIWTHLPDDFGSSGYSQRRASDIEQHLTAFGDKDQMSWLFDYWFAPSRDLRHYLWAHAQRDADTARTLLGILPAEKILVILRYLVGSYWNRYLGWPDLLAYRPGEYCLLEIKSSGDKLSVDQKNWIAGNYATLRLPFKLVKVHKAGVVRVP